MTEINIIGLAERIPDEASAYEYLETLRWPNGPECPHCGNTDKCYFLKPPRRQYPSNPHRGTHPAPPMEVRVVP